MNQAIIKRLTEIIHANLDNENFGVKELAIAAGMSRSTLHRMLMYYSKKSASRFIREVRLQKAMEMLQQDVATVSEISYRVGFNSPAYFNTCFHHYFGYTPGEVKKKHSGETAYNNTENIEGTITGEEELVSLARKPVRREPFIRLTVINTLVMVMVILFLPYFLYISFTKEAYLLKENRLKSNDKTIVVLPFKNLSGNPENQYFADGVQEDILNHLLRIKELKIISPANGEYPAINTSASDIARKLNANFILQGSVQQYEGKVRINTQFIDARLEKLIWSEKYDSKLANIFKIQSNIAKQVADKLQTVLSSGEIEYIEKVQTKIPEAYTMYLKGRFLWNMRTENELKKSVEFFEMALVADPDYALAYAGMADAYFLQAWWGWFPQEEGYAKSKEFTLRALELDKNLAEAHATLGALLCWSDHKWTEAQKEFTLAIELNQHYALTYQYYSELLDIIGNNVEARKQINIALKHDPFSPELHFLSALYYYHESQFDESLNECRQVEKLDPNSILIHWRYFHNYFWKGDDLNAVKTIQEIMTMDSLTMKYAGTVKEVYNTSKINGLLRWLMQLELKKSRPDALTIARLYSLLGKKNEAMFWIEKAWEKRSPGILKINNDPDFENLHRYAKFKEIINQLGLSADRYETAI